ncbi:MAG: addiction module protein [Magnetococcus sp. YQC-5]
MNTTTQDIFQQALMLAPVERAKLVDKLLHSFNPERRHERDLLWSEEAESRIAGYDTGKITDDSMEDVLTRLNQR